MRNLSISKKLILGFGSVLALMIITAVISIISVDNISEQTNLYAKHTVPGSRYMYKMQVDMRAASQYILDAILADDVASTNAAIDEANAWGEDFSKQKEAFKKVQRNDALDADIAKIDEILNEASSARARIVSLATENTEESKTEALSIYQNTYEPAVEQVTKILSGFEEISQEHADVQSETVTQIVERSWFSMIFALIVSIVVTLGLTYIIRKSILTPVKEIVNVYDEMSKGNLHVNVNYESKDEMGQMAQSIRKTNEILISYINDIADKLQMMSNGDMRFDVDLDYIGDFAAIKQAIENTANSLNHTLQIINIAAEQVSTGATQVSSGAQALALGSTEQASSVEELNATVSNIADEAAANSKNVKIATQYVEQAGIGVETGNEHMEQLTKAMNDINTSSNQIAEITKVIEDIAFQTNILALNAAIEAARAGNAGKGFAVVADEVRNLAAKSAEASKQTSNLIQASVATVTKGAQITQETAQILQDIREKTKLVIGSITKIDESSAKQAVAIEEIKQGLNQVSSVVQTNVATAEENSATSEEMSAQAVTLHKEVSKFKLKNHYKDGYFTVPSFQDSEKEETSFEELESSMGKY